jgi:hypothetical protein
MALIGLYVPADAPWLPDLRAELLAFPTGRHDDQVDALGLCGQLMDKFSPGIVPRPKDQEDAWDRAYGEMHDDAWDTGSSIKLL